MCGHSLHACRAVHGAESDWAWVTCDIAEVSPELGHLPAEAEARVQVTEPAEGAAASPSRWRRGQSPRISLGAGEEGPLQAVPALGSRLSLHPGQGTSRPPATSWKAQG